MNIITFKRLIIILASSQYILKALQSRHADFLIFLSPKEIYVVAVSLYVEHEVLITITIKI